MALFSDEKVTQQIGESEQNVKCEVWASRKDEKAEHTAHKQSIADLDVKLDKVLAEIAELREVNKPAFKVSYSEAQEQAVVSLRSQGCSYNNIVSKTGLSRNVVRSIVRKHPQTTPQVCDTADNTAKECGNNSESAVKLK